VVVVEVEVVVVVNVEVVVVVVVTVAVVVVLVVEVLVVLVEVLVVVVVVVELLVVLVVVLVLVFVVEVAVFEVVVLCCFAFDVFAWPFVCTVSLDAVLLRWALWVSSALSSSSTGPGSVVVLLWAWCAPSCSKSCCSITRTMFSPKPLPSIISVTRQSGRSSSGRVTRSASFRITLKSASLGI